MSTIEPSAVHSRLAAATSSPRPRLVVLCAATLVACFARVHYDLFQFAVSNQLYSHVLIVPAISLYLLWLKRDALKQTSGSPKSIAIFFFSLGIFSIIAYWALAWSDLPPFHQDYLAWTVFSFFLCCVGMFGFFFGDLSLRQFAFPIGFLVFMTPFPLALEEAVNGCLQRGSAAVALALFKVADMPILYHALVFRLPGITIEVAPECSGIHSSLVLFLTSLLAGYFFLSSTWKRFVLVAAVVPLAIFRNAVRIFTIGELCVYVRPEMIDSYIHRHGGPIFFFLSLIPFSLLLLFLGKSDETAQRTKANLLP